MQFTLQQVAEFAFHNRGLQAFQDSTELGIAAEILKCANGNTLIFVTDPTERFLCGVATGELFRKDFANRRTMHVNNIVTTHPAAMQAILIQFLIRWPDCDLQAYRKGKLRRYDLGRLRHSLAIYPTQQHCLAA